MKNKCLFGLGGLARPRLWILWPLMGIGSTFFVHETLDGIVAKPGSAYHEILDGIVAKPGGDYIH